MTRHRDIEAIFMHLLKYFVLKPQKSQCHKPLNFQDKFATEIPEKNK